MERKPWTEDEESYLEYFLLTDFKTPYDEIEKFLGRSKISVQGKIQKMRKKNKKLEPRAKPWGKKEDQFLLRNYQIMSYHEIGTALNRSFSSVENRMRKLGMRKANDLASKKDEIQRLSDEGLNQNEIAKKLGFSRKAIWNFCDQNGIKINYESTRNRVFSIQGRQWAERKKQIEDCNRGN